MSAGSACRTCGAESREGARFCDTCGAVIAPATEHAEYKQVTVLFADVVESMGIAVAVGTERLREIMTKLVNRAAAVVQRYGGTVDKFTGDGIMAVFGAPLALEDHAFRACLAALDIQAQVAELADEIGARDGVAFLLRIGLNSGQVIAGELASGTVSYTAIGEQVGMAQRMESVAPPGGVMLSGSTARLVEGAVLGETEMVHIKNRDDPVPARRLLSLTGLSGRTGPSYSTLVGRDWELAALAAMLDRSMGGLGCVVAVTGPAGIGKSRLVSETVRLAKSRGVDVFPTFCESHATDIPFHVVGRLLRVVGQVSGLDDRSARARLREKIPDADPEDMRLLDDLLGCADPNVELPQIDPDARRRRLTALINSALLARNRPAIFVVEDAHWIDEVSESMLADFLSVIPQTHSLVLLTFRPEYQGALWRVTGAQSIALAPLSGPETSMLIAGLLGTDASTGEIGEIIAARAAGNPFFAEEIVRDLADRGVLRGAPGAYVSTAEIAEVTVPATLQAAIAARIDRLPPAAKSTLAAAAVIGSRFSPELLNSLTANATIDELIRAELIDQVRFTSRAEYAFRHPLVRTVAYESQLKADRAVLHRRLAAAIEAHEPELGNQNAAMIAEHLEAAGELHAAYSCHMRAATWATNRDIAAARVSWDRAQRIADALPADDPNRSTMQIAPRTMLCGTAYRVRMTVAADHFDELRALCAAADDKASLAIATAGLVANRAYEGRVREASQLASEVMALIESVGDSNLTVGLSFAAIYAKLESGDWPDVLRWSQRVIELADGDPAKSNFIVGSPLALAIVARAITRYAAGRHGWRDELRQGVAMARGAGPMSYATVITYVYGGAIPNGVLEADDFALSEIEDALRIAERSGNNHAFALAQFTLGLALVHRLTAAERDRGRKLLAEVSEVFRQRAYNLAELPIVEVYLAREQARRGDQDEAIPLMRRAVGDLFGEGLLLTWGVSATAVLVETLLDRGADGDVAEAEAAIDRLAPVPGDGWVARDVVLLRLQALLARARGDDAAYEHFRNRYRDTARALDFDGHRLWAEVM